MCTNGGGAAGFVALFERQACRGEARAGVAAWQGGRLVVALFERGQGWPCGLEAETRSELEETPLGPQIDDPRARDPGLLPPGLMDVAADREQRALGLDCL